MEARTNMRGEPAGLSRRDKPGGSPRSVVTAFLVLILAGCGRSTSDWVRRLRSPESSERLHAVKALGDRPKEADVVVPALADALHDEDAFVRRDAAEALGRIGPASRPGIPALVGALRDANGAVRREAARALRRIDPATAGAGPAP